MTGPGEPDKDAPDDAATESPAQTTPEQITPAQIVPDAAAVPDEAAVGRPEQQQFAGAANYAFVRPQDSDAQEEAVAALHPGYTSPFAGYFLLNAPPAEAEEDADAHVATAPVTDITRCPWCGAQVDVSTHCVHTHPGGLVDVSPEVDCPVCDHLYIVNQSNAHVVAIAKYDE